MKELCDVQRKVYPISSNKKEQLKNRETRLSDIHGWKRKFKIFSFVRYLFLFWETYKPSVVFLIYVILRITIKDFTMGYWDFKDMVFAFLAVFRLWRYWYTYS